ncbi:MAG: AAA family ATPase [Hyphomonas sp.]|nr:AAA family ATPase [Hyphomonas sp.]
MRIEKVRIENFGCIEAAEVKFDGYTAIIGPNNSGKSTILKAIDRFFANPAKVEKSDFFRHDETRTIAITIQFGSLTPDERAEFGSAVIDGQMTVTRHFGGEFGLSGPYSVVARMNPAFSEFREEENGTSRRAIYARLREPFGLPAAAGEAMDEAIRRWEAEHADELEDVRARGFFGAVNVANGKLKRKTSVRLVPAVYNVKDATNSKSSPIIELLQDIRRQALENQHEFQGIIADANARILNFIENSDIHNVRAIGQTVTELLQKYYADTRIEAELPPPGPIEPNFPSPTLKVVHRDIAGPIENVGHGLQRAVLFSVIQFLAQHFLANPQAGDNEFDEAASDIVVLIEEPECYQHPQKQRIIRTVLQAISESYDRRTGIRIQVIVCTHSEKFIRIQSLDAIRLINTTYQDEVSATNVRGMKLADLRDLLHAARGQGAPMPLNTFAAGMHVFSEAISEGFFADKVVLVEGVGDLAAIEGAFLAAGVDHHGEGIAIVPVDGKTKLDKPLQTFRHLSIPTFCIFDNDSTKEERKQKTTYNKLLQRICGVEEPVAMPSGLYPENFAAFDGDLECYLRGQVGDRYDEVRDQVTEMFQLGPDDSGKSPAAVAAFLRMARDRGCSFPLLDDVVRVVQAMRV